MQKNWTVIAAIAVFVMPALTLHAQEGRPGPLPGHNPAPTSPVTGNAANGRNCISPMAATPAMVTTVRPARGLL